MERLSCVNRKKIFKSKDHKQFKAPRNQLSLGDSLLHNGKIISDRPSFVDCWTQHFTAVSKTRLDSNPNVSAALNDLDHLYCLSKMNGDGIIDDEVSVEEIEAALRS